MNIMYKHIYLNFGVISFIDKEMVTFIQLHTYKFGLVYIYKIQIYTCSFEIGLKFATEGLKSFKMPKSDS